MYVTKFRRTVSRPHKILNRASSWLEKPLYLTGNFALVTLASSWITSGQIESARKVIKRLIKKHGKLKVRVYSFLSLTRKPSEVRMGKGKGKLKISVAPVVKGRILFEVQHKNKFLAKNALILAKDKFNIPVKVIRLVDFNCNNKG